MEEKRKIGKAAQVLVDVDRGLVYAGAYSDEEVYREELERDFGHTWLFVGHESSIPRAGDYLTNYMGEDPVIVLRDFSGNVRVFLNKCLHRGEGSQRIMQARSERPERFGQTIKLMDSNIDALYKITSKKRFAPFFGSTGKIMGRATANAKIKDPRPDTSEGVKN